MITARVFLATKVENGDTVALTFAPDYQDPANKAWANATPALNLSMTVRQDVAEKFTAGKPYELQFVERTP
jgi:hypothetical protein